MEGTYSEVTYQYSDLNSQRYQGAMGIEHEMSAISSVSVNVQSGRISYQDATINPPSINRRYSFIIRPPVRGRRLGSMSVMRGETDHRDQFTSGVSSERDTADVTEFSPEYIPEPPDCGFRDLVSNIADLIGQQSDHAGGATTK